MSISCSAPAGTAGAAAGTTQAGAVAGVATKAAPAKVSIGAIDGRQVIGELTKLQQAIAGEVTVGVTLVSFAKNIISCDHVVHTVERAKLLRPTPADEPAASAHDMLPAVLRPALKAGRLALFLTAKGEMAQPLELPICEDGFGGLGSVLELIATDRIVDDIRDMERFRHAWLQRWHDSRAPAPDAAEGITPSGVDGMVYHAAEQLFGSDKIKAVLELKQWSELKIRRTQSKKEHDSAGYEARKELVAARRRRVGMADAHQLLLKITLLGKAAEKGLQAAAVLFLCKRAAPSECCGAAMRRLMERATRSDQPGVSRERLEEKRKLIDVYRKKFDKLSYAGREGLLSALQSTDITVMTFLLDAALEDAREAAPGGPSVDPAEDPEEAAACRSATQGLMDFVRRASAAIEQEQSIPQFEDPSGTSESVRLLQTCRGFARLMQVHGCIALVDEKNLAGVERTVRGILRCISEALRPDDTAQWREEQEYLTDAFLWDPLTTHWISNCTVDRRQWVGEVEQVKHRVQACGDAPAGYGDGSPARSERTARSQDTHSTMRTAASTASSAAPAGLQPARASPATGAASAPAPATAPVPVKDPPAPVPAVPVVAPGAAQPVAPAPAPAAAPKAAAAPSPAAAPAQGDPTTGNSPPSVTPTPAAASVAAQPPVAAQPQQRPPAAPQRQVPEPAQADTPLQTGFLDILRPQKGRDEAFTWSPPPYEELSRSTTGLPELTAVLDNGGQKLLHHFARRGWGEYMWHFVADLHDNVNCKDDGGMSPLHVAARDCDTLPCGDSAGLERIVCRLMDVGADRWDVNEQGQNAIDMLRARALEVRQALELLRPKAKEETEELKKQPIPGAGGGAPGGGPFHGGDGGGSDGAAGGGGGGEASAAGQGLCGLQTRHQIESTTKPGQQEDAVSVTSQGLTATTAPSICASSNTGLGADASGAAPGAASGWQAQATMGPWTQRDRYHFQKEVVDWLRERSDLTWDPKDGDYAGECLRLAPRIRELVTGSQGQILGDGEEVSWEGDVKRFFRLFPPKSCIADIKYLDQRRRAFAGAGYDPRTGRPYNRRSVTDRAQAKAILDEHPGQPAFLLWPGPHGIWLAVNDPAAGAERVKHFQLRYSKGNDCVVIVDWQMAKAAGKSKEEQLKAVTVTEKRTVREVFDVLREGREALIKPEMSGAGTPIAPSDGAGVEDGQG
eukprot:TRINITY_DN14498_c0_g1_i1.p1 TRINITY_DN14498_c0_g1~~TRINITY_DN14498_c0_g1_i1.p1  ORF type:complete len:1225 (+),score=237.23 TRINITY_DN14498_c0_g1_i1:97-3675(+)